MIYDGTPARGRDATAAGRTARMPGWYLVGLAASMLALTLAAPLARLAHAPSVGSALVTAFIVLVLGSRVGLRVWSRGGRRAVSGRGIMPAVMLWVALIAVTVGGFLASLVLTRHGHAVLAIVLSVLVVAASVVGLAYYYGFFCPDPPEHLDHTPTSWAHDRPGLGRLQTSEGTSPRSTRASYAPGDRVVWNGVFFEGCQWVYSGTYVANGPAPYVTVRHDGAPSDARVRPERLYREPDYLALVESRGYPPPTPWAWRSPHGSRPLAERARQHPAGGGECRGHERA